MKMHCLEPVYEDKKDEIVLYLIVCLLCMLNLLVMGLLCLANRK